MHSKTHTHPQFAHKTHFSINYIQRTETFFLLSLNLWCTYQYTIPCVCVKVHTSLWTLKSLLSISNVPPKTDFQYVSLPPSEQTHYTSLNKELFFYPSCYSHSDISESGFFQILLNFCNWQYKKSKITISHFVQPKLNFSSSNHKISFEMQYAI